MKDAFRIMSRSEHDAGGGRAVGIAGSVYGVDVIDEGFVMWERGEQDAAFEVPGGREGGCVGCDDVAPDEGADTVDFPGGSGGVVGVAGEGEVGVVEAVGFVCFIGGVEGGVDETADEGLGFGVVGDDFDFLEGEDVRPFPAAEAGSEGGLGGEGF